MYQIYQVNHGNRSNHGLIHKNIPKISIDISVLCFPMGSPHLFGLARLQGVHHFVVDLGVGIKLCLQNSLPKKLGFIGFMLLD